METQNSCPDNQRLGALLSGATTETEFAALEAHIGVCPECRARLEALSGSEAVVASGRNEPFTALSRSPALVAAMDKLRNPSLWDETLVMESAKVQHVLPYRSFGDYELLKEIGRGGMGVVFQARQKSLNRTVALKLVSSGGSTSTRAAQRFQNEAEAAASLDHPNIVPVYDFGEHEGQRYFSMKLIAGRSLAEVMADARAKSVDTGEPFERQSALSQPTAVARLMESVARAVHYAHQRGVLHRDLKPSNILIDEFGSPHLTDFGLAKFLNKETSLTRTREVMGTPNYIAPEQAQGESRQITTAADIFSLGAMLYELLTGRPPFDREELMATLRAVVEEEPAPPRTLHRNVSRDLETICLKCLEKDRTRRYGSAQELADDLGRFARGEPVWAHPTTTWERAAKWFRREPKLAGSLVGLAAVFIFGFASTTWKWRAELHQRQATEKESLRASKALTRLELDRIETLFQTGESPQALAHLARLVREQPTNRVATERLMSALSDRNFCLPIASLSHGPALDSLTETERAELGPVYPFRYPGSVVSASVSRDGENVVTSSEDGTARLWNVRTGEMITPPLRHAAEVLWADFSRDGQQVVTASLDKTARVWNVKTGEAVTAPLRHERGVWHAEFSPDGRKLVTASEDKTAAVWTLNDGLPEFKLMEHTGAAYFAAFGPEGSRIITASRPSLATVWLGPAGLSVRKRDHFYFRESSSPFPALNAAGDRFVTLRAFDALLGSEASLKDESDVYVSFANPVRLAHENYLLAACFSPDGRMVATASMDATARVWDGRNGTPKTAPLRHNGWVFSVDFAQDGQSLVTGSRDKTARVWKVASGQPAVEPMNHESAVLIARSALQGQRIVTVCESDTAWLWASPAAGQPSMVAYLGQTATLAQFSPDNRRIVVITDQTATVLNARSGERSNGPFQHAATYPIWDARFSPNGEQLATASQFGDARVWDLTSNRSVQFQHSNEVRHVEFSADARRLLTASDDGTAGVWDIKSGKRIFTLKHHSRVRYAAFNRDDTAIATASSDGTAQIWDAGSGKPISPPLVHGAEVSWVGFSPDGRRLATASRDKTVRLWDCSDGRALTKPLSHADELGERHAVEFNRTGSRLVTAAGNLAQVWDTETGRPVTTPVKHAGLIQSVRFSPDGSRFVTAGSDGVVAQWDTETGHTLSEPIRHAARVGYADFSSDGLQVLTCSADKTARICAVARASLPSPTWLPALAEALAGLRVDRQDVGEVVSVQQLYQLKESLKAAGGSDYYARWGRWFASGRTNEFTPPREVSVETSVSIDSSTKSAKFPFGAYRKAHRGGGWSLISKEGYVHATNAVGEARTPRAKFDALQEAAWQSLQVGHYGDARRFATSMLTMAPQFRATENQDPAMHSLHTVLGSLALRDGRLEVAKQHLLDSGRVRLPEGFKDFYPKFSLAEELLEKGEPGVVLEFLEQCHELWPQDNGVLDRWKDEIKAGNIPFFEGIIRG